MGSVQDNIRLRLKIFAAAVLLIFLGIAARVFYVQIIRHDYYYPLAREKYVVTRTATGQRGEIFDHDGYLLVGNMPCVEITAAPCNVPAAQDGCIAELLAEVLKVDPEPLRQKLAVKTREVRELDAAGNPTGRMVAKEVQYVMLARNVSLDDAARIKAAVQERRLRGLVFRNTSKRYYPNNELLANILGFTNVENDQDVAVMGIEKFLDSQMRPSSEKLTYERSRDGRKLTVDENSPAENVSRYDGMNIYLTIREPLQAILEEELDLAVEKWHPKAVYAVMADPWTGDILAMAQRPSFNPNTRAGFSAASGRVSIAEDVIEPGSIMKALTVSGALDLGVVTPDTIIDCEAGTWVYAGKRLTDTHGYGIQNVTGVIRKSSNIGTAKIAMMMGEARLNYTLRKFGLGARTGLPLRVETRGRFPTLDRWDKLSITRFGMGYGISVSPVQMLRAYCAIANGGYLYDLRLVDRAENPQTGEVIPNPIRPVRSIFRRPQTSGEITKMLVTVTEPGGTALKAAIPGYHVAGKTGTANKVENGHYVPKYYGSFVGFVPAEKPAFVLLVTLDEPHGAHFGGTVAGPTWHGIAEKTLKFLDVKPDPALLPASKKKAK